MLNGRKTSLAIPSWWQQCYRLNAMIFLLMMFFGLLPCTKSEARKTHIWYAGPSNKIYPNVVAIAKCDADLRSGEMIRLIFESLSPKVEVVGIYKFYHGYSNLEEVVRMPSFTGGVNRVYRFNNISGILFAFCPDPRVFQEGKFVCDLLGEGGTKLIARDEFHVISRVRPLTPVVWIRWHFLHSWYKKGYLIPGEYFLVVFKAVLGSSAGGLVIDVYQKYSDNARLETWVLPGDVHGGLKLGSRYYGPFFYKYVSTPQGPRITLSAWQKGTIGMLGHYFVVTSTDNMANRSEGLVRTTQSTPLVFTKGHPRPALDIVSEQYLGNVLGQTHIFRITCTCKAKRELADRLSMAFKTRDLAVEYYQVNGTGGHRMYEIPKGANRMQYSNFTESRDATWIYGKIVAFTNIEMRPVTCKCRVRNFVTCVSPKMSNGELEGMMRSGGEKEIEGFGGNALRFFGLTSLGVTVCLSMSAIV